MFSYPGALPPRQRAASGVPAGSSRACCPPPPERRPIPPSVRPGRPAGHRSGPSCRRARKRLTPSGPPTSWGAGLPPRTPGGRGQPPVRASVSPRTCDNVRASEGGYRRVRPGVAGAEMRRSVNGGGVEPPREGGVNTVHASQVEFSLQPLFASGSSSREK